MPNKPIEISALDMAKVAPVATVDSEYRARQNDRMRALRDKLKSENVTQKDITEQTHEVQSGETLGAIVLAYEKAYQAAKKVDLGLNWATMVRVFDKDGKQKGKDLPMAKVKESLLGTVVGFEKGADGKLIVTVRPKDAKKEEPEKKPDPEKKDKPVSKPELSAESIFGAEEFADDNFYSFYKIENREQFQADLIKLKEAWLNDEEISQLLDEKFWEIKEGEAPSERETRYYKLFESSAGKVWNLNNAFRPFLISYGDFVKDSESVSATKMMEMFLLTGKKLLEFNDRFTPSANARRVSAMPYHLEFLDRLDPFKANKKIGKDVLAQLVESAKFMMENDPDPKYKDLYENYSKLLNALA